MSESAIPPGPHFATINSFCAIPAGLLEVSMIEPWDGPSPERDKRIDPERDE